MPEIYMGWISGMHVYLAVFLHDVRDICRIWHKVGGLFEIVRALPATGIRTRGVYIMRH